MLLLVLVVLLLAGGSCALLLSWSWCVRRVVKFCERSGRWSRQNETQPIEENRQIHWAPSFPWWQGEVLPLFDHERPCGSCSPSAPYEPCRNLDRVGPCRVDLPRSVGARAVCPFCSSLLGEFHNQACFVTHQGRWITSPVHRDEMLLCGVHGAGGRWTQVSGWIAVLVTISQTHFGWASLQNQCPKPRWDRVVASSTTA
jgi:hypothetical protein